MSRGNSLLFNVAYSNEDSITEMLCNLMQLSYARRVILSSMGIRQDIIDGITYEQIDSQRTFSEVGRPDITIENDHCLIFIEVKTAHGTSLQESQYSSYPAKLKADGRYSRLIFLVPQNYQDERMTEAIKANKALACRCHWDQLVRELYRNDLHRSNQIVAEYLQHFESTILERTVSNALNAREVAIMYNVEDLINAHSMLQKVKEATRESWWLIKEGVDDQFSPSENAETEDVLGKYLNFNGKTLIFYGLWFSLVKEHKELSDYIFSFCIEESLAKEKDVAGRGLGFHAEAWDGWYFKKLPKYLLTEEKATELLAKEIIKEINAALGRRKK